MREISGARRLADPLPYRYDSPSSDEPKDSGRGDAAASSRALAEYLADMIGQLEGMARLSGFDLLVYLLSMARVEAEANARSGVDRRSHLKY